MPKIFVKKPFPFSFDGNQVVQIQEGEQDVSDRCALVAVEHLEVAVYVDPAASWTFIGPSQPDPDALRQDGPTVGEYVEAGYPAASYPPKGYAARSSPEEIAQAISDQEEAQTNPLKMTVPKLKDWLTAKGIEFNPAAKKDELQALVPKND